MIFSKTISISFVRSAFERNTFVRTVAQQNLRRNNEKIVSEFILFCYGKYATLIFFLRKS